MKVLKNSIIILLLAACLVACGKTANETVTTVSDAETQESITETESAPETAPVEQTEGSAAEEPEEQAKKRILVMETTDIHGWIIETSSGNQETYQYRLAHIASVINKARESGEYDDVLLLDGGDLYQGPPVSNMLYGAPIRAYLDMMKYDAVALGNHEFDWDVTVYAADQDATVAPYELDEFKGDPDIPVVASGLYFADTGERVPFTKDYVMIEKAGKRIAVIGYIPDYSSSVMSSKIAPYRIDGSHGRFNELVSEINRNEDPDITVVLAHSQPGPLAEALDPEQVDLVLGGHSHKAKSDKASNGIPYMQGNCKAQGYASAVIVTGADGSITVEDVNYNDIVADKAALYDSPENADHLDSKVLDISFAAWSKVWEQMSEVLGYIDTPALTGKEGETSGAGNLLTGCMLRATKEYGTVAAFYNQYGIRTDLKISSGEYIRQITLYDIYSMLPFGNSVLIYELTGEELARQLELGLEVSNYGDQLSGLTFTYRTNGNDKNRPFEVVSITLDDGTEIDLHDKENTYRVAVTDYSATLSGSIFENKQPVLGQADAPIDHDLVIEQLRKERDEGDGYIFVDTASRGTLVE